MKKILIFVLFDVVILVILVALYFAAPTLSQIEPISGPASEYQNFVNDLFGIKKEEPIVEREPVDVPETQNEIDDEPIDVADTDEIEEQDQEEENGQKEETSGPKPAIIDLKFYSDELINFTYPEEFVIVEITDTTYEMQTEQGNLIATFDIFENQSNFLLEDFLKLDNIIDYLDEAERVAIKPETIMVADETVYLKDFPGFLTQDIYLVRIPDYVFLIQVRNQKEVFRKYIISTLEAKG